MRIAMALSNTTILAIKQYKYIKFNNVNVTYGYLVTKAYQQLESKIDIIDFEAVNLSEDVFLRSIDVNCDFDNIRKKTTLNLEATTVQSLEYLRDKFKTIFCTKRLYLPFVLKLLFLAVLLDEQGKLPLKKGLDKS